jgi:hypothetical protein
MSRAIGQCTSFLDLAVRRRVADPPILAIDCRIAARIEALPSGMSWLSAPLVPLEKLAIRLKRRWKVGGAHAAR